MTRRGVFLLALLWVCPAFAQESTSYKLKESVFNAGGDPYRGSVLSSASYRIRLDAVGDSVAQTGLQGPSFHLDGGFVSAYPPPTEIAGLRFLADKVTLRWDPEKSVGAYNLYRDLLTALAGGSSGSCLQASIVGEAAIDQATPPLRDGYFYLATARNRLDEEGTKGFRSSGVERPNPLACP